MEATKIKLHGKMLTPGSTHLFTHPSVQHTFYPLEHRLLIRHSARYLVYRDQAGPVLLFRVLGKIKNSKTLYQSLEVHQGGPKS